MSFTWQDQPIAAAPPPPPTAVEHYDVQLTKVTSMVLLTRRQAHVYAGSLAELEAAYRRVLLHNLALGWWDIPFGLFWTPVWLSRNRAAMRAVRELAGQDGLAGVRAPSVRSRRAGSS